MSRVVAERTDAVWKADWLATSSDLAAAPGAARATIGRGEPPAKDATASRRGATSPRVLTLTYAPISSSMAVAATIPRAALDESNRPSERGFMTRSKRVRWETRDRARLAHHRL